MYDIIYADPPWTYRVYSKKGEGRTASSHYQVMTLDDIKAMKISSLASRDCTLFMWVTAPNLVQGIEVISSWGFEFKTVAFTWIKKNKIKDSLFWGMGFWTRANAEFCLLATRGSPKRVCKGVHSVVVSKIGRHSEKPAEVRDRIVTLMGNLPRVELFARERTEGWSAWGNEIENDSLPIL